MAEFQEVMKQKKRICTKYTGGGICQSKDYDICPLKGHDLCSKTLTLINIDKIQEGEEIIMRWAAEHPEPVYPTWEEWLQSVGVMESSEGLLRRIKGQLLIDGIPAHAVPTSKVLQPMDAEIAQKLGIRMGKY